MAEITTKNLGVMLQLSNTLDTPYSQNNAWKKLYFEIIQYRYNFLL